MAGGGAPGGGGGGGGAPAPAPAPAQQRSFWALALQVAVAFTAFRYFTSSQSGASGKADTPVAGSHPTAVGVPPMPTASSTPEPGMMGTLSALMRGQTAANTVHPLLRDFDALRRQGVGAAGKVALSNRWPAGQSFDFLVFVSDGVDVPCAYAEAPASAGGADADADTTAQQAVSALRQRAVPQAGVSVKDLFAENSNVYTLFAAASTLVFPNATSNALAQLLPGSGVPHEQSGRSSACALVWHQQYLTYDWEDTNYREQAFNLTWPAGLSHNATLFAHLFFVPHDALGTAPTANGEHRLPRGPTDALGTTLHMVYPLTKHLPRKPHKQVVNLLSGEPSSSSAKAASSKPTSAPTPASGSGVDTGAPASTSGDGATSGALPYWRPCLHTQLLVDFTTHNPNGMMPHVAPLIVAHAPSRRYLPLGLVSDFWLMDHQLVELNSSVTSVPLVISFSPGSMWKWTLQHQMSMSWEMQETLGTSSAGEKDMIKSVLLETNPILLAITMIVSTLHMVFDTLAFKNDISFWRNTKTLEGLSVRSIAVGVFVQTVIVLYLFDNDTSWMVLMSSVVGLAIEIWKLRKAVSVSVEWTPAGWPRLRWDDKDEAYSTSHTKEYDDIATGHMLYILYPLVVGYAVYSLVYQEHRSWYSWLLSSLTGFVYTFGFIQMVPQLYINYRLKSVAHMPWRAMVYKSLNTFIDDLFAWVIKMPTLHRIAVFRDDIIFLIYLYQRYIYPVDKARKNEFGASAEDYEALRNGTLQQPPLAAAASAAAPVAALPPAAAPPAAVVARRSKFERK